MANELIDVPPNNVPGRYWVDHICLICSDCTDIAPDVFRHDEEHSRTVVYRQPETPEQIARAEYAISRCPYQAIRNDGDRPRHA